MIVVVVVIRLLIITIIIIIVIIIIVIIIKTMSSSGQTIGSCRNVSWLDHCEPLPFSSCWILQVKFQKTINNYSSSKTEGASHFWEVSSALLWGSTCGHHWWPNDTIVQLYISIYKLFRHWGVGPCLMQSEARHCSLDHWLSAFCWPWSMAAAIQM